MKANLGPSKLMWHPGLGLGHYTNKQRAFEFMADEVMLEHDAEVQQKHIDRFLLEQILGREPTDEEMIVDIQHTTSMRLKCVFKNPHYGKQIAKRFIRRLIKNWQPQQMLLIPNYGLAARKDQVLFWRACPSAISAEAFTFHILPTDETGERTRHGL